MIMMKLMEVKCKVTSTNRDKRQYAERHFLLGNKQLYMAVGLREMQSKCALSVHFQIK